MYTFAPVTQLKRLPKIVRKFSTTHWGPRPPLATPTPSFWRVRLRK